MRYILIDPVAETVTEHEADFGKGDTYKPMYPILECSSIEELQVAAKPVLRLLVNGNGMFAKPPLIAWSLGPMEFVGRGMLVGSRGSHYADCRLTLSAVIAQTRFGIAIQRRDPSYTIKTFDPKDLLAEVDRNLRARLVL